MARLAYTTVFMCPACSNWVIQVASIFLHSSEYVVRQMEQSVEDHVEQHELAEHGLPPR